MSNPELEAKLKHRLQESLQIREAQQNQIQAWQAELKSLIQKVQKSRNQVSGNNGGGNRKTTEHLEQEMAKLERERTTKSMSLAEERQILKQLAQLQKQKGTVEEIAQVEVKIQDIKAQLDQKKEEHSKTKASFQELEAALSKVKLANSLDCATSDLTTIECQLPADKLGMIIGKQGSQIQEWMDKFKVTIDVDKTSLLAKITGSPSNVSMAKTAMERIAKAVEVELQLEPSLSSYLVSSNVTDDLARLKAKYSDIFLEVLRGSGKAILRGDPDLVEAAKKDIQAISITSESQTLSKRELGYVLGRKGARIDQLVQEHKVVMDVSKKSENVDDTATVVVSGPPERVTQAMEAIQTLLDDNKEVTESITVEPVIRQILLESGGQNIKAMQAQVNEQLQKEDDTANCYLSFPKIRDSSSQNELTVKAKQSALEQAIELTQAALKPYLDLMVTLSVDPYVIPRIIGKGGETIKQLTQGKPVFLEVDRSKNIVVVAGTTQEEMQGLLRQVQDLLTENTILRIKGDDVSLMVSQYREMSRSKTKAALQELAWMELDEASSEFILRGSPENLKQAQTLLEEFIANNSVDELTGVPEDDLDILLMGGKTSKIVQFSADLEVNLSVDKASRTIKIRGPPAKVSQAKQTLSEFMYGANGEAVAKLSVSEELVGAIVGKGGKTRKELEAKHGVSMHIAKSTHRVSIRGPEEGVQACRLEILKIISAARITKTVSVTEEQAAKLEKSGVLKRIQQQSSSHVTMEDQKVTIRGSYHDAGYAASLLDEQLTGEYCTEMELDASQFKRAKAAWGSYSQQMNTEAKVTMNDNNQSIQVRGKRSDVKSTLMAIMDFLSFVCPENIERIKVTRPLFATVASASALADIAAHTGVAAIYLDRDLNSILIRDGDSEKVQAALKLVQAKIADAERFAYVLEVAPDEAWLLAFVIGKNGARVQALQKGSGCHVEVSKESRTISVTGDEEENVVAVRAKLDALVEQGRSENLFVNIPEAAIPAFVGQGGKNIKQLATEHDVEIQRVKKSSKFNVTGEADKAAACKATIDAWLAQYSETHASEEHPIQKQYVSAILGEKGKTIAGIQKEFGCKIDIDRDAGKLKISGGNPEKRQGSWTRISEVIEKEAAVKAEAAARRKAAADAAAAASASEAADAAAAAPPAPTTATAPLAKPTPASGPPKVPVGLAPPNANGKSKKSSSPPPQGTEQGRNLFNLLVEG